MDQPYCSMRGCYGNLDVWVVIDGVGMWVCQHCATNITDPPTWTDEDGPREMVDVRNYATPPALLDANGYCPECGRDYYDKDSTPTHCTSDDCPSREG